MQSAASAQRINCCTPSFLAFSAFSTALKYLYELTFNSPTEASSATMMPFWWFWRAETVHIWLYGPSTASLMARAFLGPNANMTTSRESVTVATPTESACAGTFEGSLSKKRLFTMRVSSVRVTTRVRLVRGENGSLNAMCPSSPIPPRKRSNPPAFTIASSYAAHSASRSAAFPLRMWMFSAGSSICEKRLWCINE